MKGLTDKIPEYRHSKIIATSSGIHSSNKTGTKNILYKTRLREHFLCHSKYKWLDHWYLLREKVSEEKGNNFAVKEKPTTNSWVLNLEKQDTFSYKLGYLTVIATEIYQCLEQII